jgi:Arc/MetJ-type ribon-helix-helix transcriptional regulator
LGILRVFRCCQAGCSEVMREGLRLLEQRVAEDTAKIEALRRATSIGIMDLEHGALLR